jgi:hypothetical protein
LRLDSKFLLKREKAQVRQGPLWLCKEVWLALFQKKGGKKTKKTNKQGPKNNPKPATQQPAPYEQLRRVWPAYNEYDSAF